MSFGNPLGFLALLGIPVVLVIHLLQVRSRRLAVSTLFLLEPRAFDRSGGSKLQRLRNSPLLWLQLLAVLFATWLVVEPRWIREDSTERVVIVVDGSASMSAFREAAADALSGYMERVERSAARVEWIVLGSDPAEKTLYAGTVRAEAFAAAKDWQSYLGVHDLDRAVFLAKPLAGARGRVLLLTDRVPDVISGVELLSVGTPVDNVGFVSVSTGGDRSFRAIVKNSSATAQRRAWWVEAGGASSPPEILTLGPGELRFVSGDFRSGERVELVLEGDRFTLDDRLPIVLPRPKTLRMHVVPALEDESFVRAFLETLQPFELVPVAEADLVLGGEGPRAGIVFAGPAPGYRGGPIVVENDPLVAGLDFRGLIARNPATDASGRVLVWHGETPLLTLSEQTLYVGFAIEESNAERIPAFVLALHRFASSVREDKRAFEQANVETRQFLNVGSEARRAPGVPGFFEIREGDELLFKGAAHFADVREADFTNARSVEPDSSAGRDAVIRNSQPDPLVAVWVLTLMGFAVAAWIFQEKGS